MESSLISTPTIKEAASSQEQTAPLDLTTESLTDSTTVQRQSLSKSQTEEDSTTGGGRIETGEIRVEKARHHN